MSRTLGNSLCTALTILLGVAVYLFSALLLKMAAKEDFLRIPGGEKVYYILHKLRLIA